MIERIRERFFPLRGKAAARKLPGAALRGNAHHVIVVKAPNELFTEAIFILRDDYCQSASDSAAELLRQAKTAAWDYAASVSVYDRRKDVLLLVLAALLVLETVGMAVMI